MSRPLAVITGASSGIGLELGAIAAQEGFDLVKSLQTTSKQGAGIFPLRVSPQTSDNPVYIGGSSMRRPGSQNVQAL